MRSKRINHALRNTPVQPARAENDTKAYPSFPMPLRLFPITALLLAFGTPSPLTAAGADSPEALLRLAKHQETILRDLNSSIKAYQRVLTFRNADPQLLAGAHLGVGRCLKRKGRLSEARRAFQTVIRQFKPFPDAVNAARTALNEIDTADPAALMPPNTLLYAELTDPGVQFDRIIQILKRSGSTADLASLYLQNRKLPLDKLLNEHTLAELTKIEAFGIGLLQFTLATDDVNIDENSRFLAVLFPGRSEAIRALVTGLAVTLPAAGVHENAFLYRLPESFGNMHLAIRSDVILLGAPRKTVTDAIDRYDGKLPGSLAKNPELRIQAAARRQDSALITYADISQIIPILKSIEFDDDDFKQANAIFGLETVERVLGRVGLTEDRLTFELDFMLTPGKLSPFFTSFRSAPFDRTVLDYIPQHAIAAVSVAFVDPIDKWKQFRRFANVIYNVEHPEGGGRPPDETISNLELLLELNIADDLLAPVRSVTLVLASSDWPKTGRPETVRPKTVRRRRLRNNIVLIVNTTDGPGLAGRLDQLADAAARFYEKDNTARASRTPITLGPTQAITYDIPDLGTPLTLARNGNTLLLASRPQPLRQCLDAKRDQTALAHLDRSHPLGNLPESMNKLVFLRIDRFLRAVARRSGIDDIATQPLNPLLLYTVEQPYEISCRLEVNDLPEVIANWVALSIRRNRPTSAPATAIASPPSVAKDDEASQSPETQLP